MATEEQKKRQLVKIFSMMIQGLASGIYDLFEDSAYALMKTVGKDILNIMQKEANHGSRRNLRARGPNFVHPQPGLLFPSNCR